MLTQPDIRSMVWHVVFSEDETLHIDRQISGASDLNISILSVDSSCFGYILDGPTKRNGSSRLLRESLEVNWPLYRAKFIASFTCFCTEEFNIPIVSQFSSTFL